MSKRLGYGLDDRGIEALFLRGIQTDSGVHPVSCPVDTGGYLPLRVKLRKE
jgi:hypothetical protein